MLIFGRKQQNSVKQLSFNLKINRKKKNHERTVPERKTLKTKYGPRLNYFAKMDATETTDKTRMGSVDQMILILLMLTS